MLQHRRKIRIQNHSVYEKQSAEDVFFHHSPKRLDFPENLLRERGTIIVLFECSLAYERNEKKITVHTCWSIIANISVGKRSWSTKCTYTHHIPRKLKNSNNIVLVEKCWRTLSFFQTPLSLSHSTHSQNLSKLFAAFVEPLNNSNQGKEILVSSANPFHEFSSSAFSTFMSFHAAVIF
jgi:hypothetical protein